MEAIAEPQQINAQALGLDAEPLPSRKPWLFTSEMAKAAAEKSKAKRQEREREAIQAKAMVAELKAAAIVEPDAEYRLNRLQRTREQLAKLDTLLDEAEDWKAAKAICEAIARLSVIEGNLAGRPLPGSRRPGREKPARGPATGGSLMADE